jgi:hypothetical protein
MPNEEIANLKRTIDRIASEREAAKKEVATLTERNKLLEQIVDEFVDSLDGESSGGDNLDFLLHQYGYVPTKGVPDEL